MLRSKRVSPRAKPDGAVSAAAGAAAAAVLACIAWVVAAALIGSCVPHVAGVFAGGGVRACARVDARVIGAWVAAERDGRAAGAGAIARAGRARVASVAGVDWG